MEYHHGLKRSARSICSAQTLEGSLDVRVFANTLQSTLAFAALSALLLNTFPILVTMAASRYKMISIPEAQAIVMSHSQALPPEEV